MQHNFEKGIKKHGETSEAPSLRDRQTGKQQGERYARAAQHFHQQEDWGNKGLTEVPVSQGENYLEYAMRIAEAADLSEQSSRAEGSGIGLAGEHYQYVSDTPQSINQGEDSSHFGSNDYQSPNTEVLSGGQYSLHNLEMNIPQEHKNEVHRGLDYFANSKVTWKDSAVETLLKSKIKSGEGAVYAFMRVNDMLKENAFRS